MVSALWTATLLSLAAVAGCAWLAALMRECGIRPVRGFVGFLKGQPKAGRVIIGAFLAALWMIAGAKPGGSGSDSASTAAKGEAESLPLQGGDDGATPSRALVDEDFARGFVLTRVGTGESFGFAAPSSATVCADWMATGAASDWTYLAPTGWSMRVGDATARRLRVHSDGWVEALPEGESPRPAVFAPLRTALGLAPEAKWPLLPASARPSLLWHLVTPSNTLMVTWRNALLGRSPSAPVSLQLELGQGGSADFRYSLSTVPDGAALPAASACGALAPVDRQVTSLGFASALDLRCVRCMEGFRARLGGLDPLSCPPGSTNTVWEHLVYSGTADGAFTLPEPTDSSAVLRISVSGSGEGVLDVGGVPVPLVGGARAAVQAAAASARPMRAPAAPPPTLLVCVPRGRTVPLYLRRDGSLTVSLSSGDFAFGVLPDPAGGTLSGWVNFPCASPTPACVHDYGSRSVTVTLPVGEGAEALMCSWSGASDVEARNVPPRSATITGSFHAWQTRSVSYTLSHPEYLFGRTTYDQPVRFCPVPQEPDPGNPDPEEDSKPCWDTGWHGSGYGSSSDDKGTREESWCCYWGTCDERCDCGCGRTAYGCCDGVPDDDEDFDEECPGHSMPYADCAPLHEADYTNAVHGIPHLGGVLYIREPPLCERIRLDVPTEHRNCCPCPDHWTNYVGVVYRSGRLRLTDSSGVDFDRTETSCDVNLEGVFPSAAVGDASLAFASNGAIYLRQDRTVLGVAIRGGPGTDLAALNALNRDFGYPMTVCTNLWDAPSMALVTNVRLPDGRIHLELADATGPFTVWYRNRGSGTHRRLLDSETMPVKDLPMSCWKSLMRRASGGDSPELPVYVTSSAPGSASLVFRYWNVIDGKFVQDEAVQRIASLLPPLRLDVSRDGRIDDGDSAAWLDGRTFYYWVNGDTVKGDRVGQTGDRSPNVSDMVVNGTFDLVNFFPVALDLSRFISAWGDRVTYVLRPEWGETDSFNFCLADVPWSRAGSIQTADITTLSGHTLSSAPLSSLPGEGCLLRCDDALARFSANSGLLICESKSRDVSLRLEIRAGDTTLYSYSAPMTILPVREMYSWLNFRHLSGERAGRGTEFHSLPEERCSKSLVFLHGANVSTEDAEQWGDIVFKRMWLSGARARFYNVDWRGDIGSSANYHENASNAFAVAGQIASAVSGIPGEKVVMAHSLGNMVVSSMIQDHGLRVSRYLMCNSAVPAEAYDPSMNLRTGKLVHPDWEEYPTNSWAASWHALFRDDLGDDRRWLGWPGRFADVLDKAVNFYSSGENGGDEVLELAADNDVGIFTGIASSLAHHSWHKQELFKGRGVGVGAGATDWSGWNIEENWLGVDKIPAERALKMGDADFRTNTVFYCHPSSMNSTNIPLLVRGAHLALGIPALVAATGVTDLSAILDQENNFNLDLTNPGIEHPNGWPSKSGYPNRWLHSDIKDVSYFFNFKFYEKATEKGGLK